MHIEEKKLFFWFSLSSSIGCLQKAQAETVTAGSFCALFLMLTATLTATLVAHWRVNLSSAIDAAIQSGRRPVTQLTDTQKHTLAALG